MQRSWCKWIEQIWYCNLSISMYIHTRTPLPPCPPHTHMYRGRDSISDLMPQLNIVPLLELNSWSRRSESQSLNHWAIAVEWTCIRTKTTKSHTLLHTHTYTYIYYIYIYELVSAIELVVRNWRYNSEDIREETNNHFLSSFKSSKQNVFLRNSSNVSSVQYWSSV